MADPLPPDIQATTDTKPGAGEPAILAPGLQDGVLEIGKRSIANVTQAAGICTSTEAANKSRAYRAYVIQNVYDGAAPNSFAAQLQKGKAWQNNFSTNWLAGLGQPLRMRLQNAVVSAPTLTYSSLPDTIENYSVKTDILQQGQTNILRNWSDFSDFLSAIAGDTSLQGYCFGVFLDPWTPFPTFFKLEDARVPDRSKMNPAKLQYFVADWDYPVQDFIMLFEDEEAAKANGYDVENCQQAAHKATVEQEGEQALTTKPRRFAEMITEGALGLSVSNGGQRIVKTWMFWNVEYDGKVSFWLIDRDTKKLLRFAYKAFDSMAHVVQIFSFEGGNSCIHSSKGIGRVLINQAIAIEKNRNRMFDSMGLASFLILQAGVAARNRLDITVNAPFVLIDENAKVQAETFQSNYEGYIAIDRFLTSAAQQAAGVWINDIINPANNQSDKTATEAKIENARGQESAVMFISRFMDKWHGLCSISQIRAWSDDNLEIALGIYRKILADPMADKKAAYEGQATADSNVLREIVAAFKKWPGGVNPDDKEQAKQVFDEISIWRESPATLRAHVLDEKYDAGIQQIYAEQAQARIPGIDQNELLLLRTQQTVGEQYAKRLVIPTPDQTVTDEATRQQLGENADMMVLGQPVPVSPRDNWQVHGSVVIAALKQLTANPPPDKLPYVEQLLNHLGAHLDTAMKAGASGNETFKQMDEFYKAFTKQLTEIIQINAHAAEAQKAVTAHLSAEAAAGGDIGQPGGGSAPEGTQPAQEAAPAAPSSGDVKESISIAYKDLDPLSKQQVLKSIGLQPSAILAKEAQEAMQVPSQPVLDAAQTAATVKSSLQPSAEPQPSGSGMPPK